MKKKVKVAHIAEVMRDLLERLRKRQVKRKCKPYVNRHEFLGKLTEEVYEVTVAVKKEDDSQMYEEALDVAEACLYFVASMEANGKVNVSGEDRNEQLPPSALSKDEIDTMCIEDVERLCDEFGLGTSGMDSALRKRLKKHYCGKKK